MSKGRSAYGISMMRAMEAFVPKEQRLFDDPFILELLPAIARLGMRRPWLRRIFASIVDKKTPGVRGSILCRTRWIDDAVQDAFSRGIRRFVILGAGFDTRAYRLPALKRRQVLEVDLPNVQADKRGSLARSGVNTSNVRFVSTDFDAVPLAEAFAKNDLPKDEPLFFVWEGVTQYLSAEAVGAVLSFVAGMPAGSEIIFTYVVKEAITKQFSPEHNEDFRKTASYHPEPWHFGIEPARLLLFLQEHHLILASDVGAEWYLANYLRPLGRSLSVSEIERIARAVV
jgi:methyltransferase (TIGR00027 family)